MVNNGIFYVMPFNLGHNSKERGYRFLYMDGSFGNGEFRVLFLEMDIV